MSQRDSEAQRKWWAEMSAEERDAWKEKVRMGKARFPSAVMTRPRKKPIVKFRGIVIP